MRQTDVLILGAGAAGLFCAAECGRRGRRTVVLDHAPSPGRKILISGGGRANFTNLGTTPENYLSENPHFARTALARYTPQDFLALVERHGIPWHEKTLGQLFCSTSARDLLAMLERECAATGRVSLQLNTALQTVTHSPSGFLLETSAGPIRAESLVVATGGLSIPKLGATGLGYDLARQFGLRIVMPRPALVPLTLAPADLAVWSPLAGVAVEVTATLGKLPQQDTVKAAPMGRRRGGSPANPAFREKALITHRGLSGPAILQISSYWQPGQPVELHLTPSLVAGQSLLAPLKDKAARRDRAAVLTLLKAHLPTRLAEQLVAGLALQGALPNSILDRLEASLQALTFLPDGTEGFSKAEVTAGGVSTADLDPRTLAARALPSLFFIGEVVDVTGWLGGYNFQWAWASAFAAAQTA